MLINCTNRSVAGISQRTRSQNSICWISYSQRSSIYIDKINTCPFWLFLILFLIFISSSHHKSVIMSTLRLLGIAINDSSHLLIENSVVNVSLFRMEVFIKRRTNHTVRVDCDSKLFSSFAYVCIVSILNLSYFLSPPSWDRTRRLPPFSTNFFKSSISVGVNWSLGAATMKRFAFLILS